MSDAAKPLQLRMRPDLIVSRETFDGRSYFVVKDPLALRYFRLETAEFAILELLDGRRSLDEMQVVLEAKFAPQQFRPEEMSQFITRLHDAGLVLSELPGQADPLLARRRKARRRARLGQLTSPLAVRLPGLDPTRLFDVVYPCVRWCFRPAALVAAALLVVAALGLFVVYHAEVLRRLPAWQEFFTPANLFVLLGLMGAIKVIHELGHGLTCRHFGGEVHELGVMFLVFAPCLYCNVSDAWRLPKRARIAVGAAGIVVELVLASLAAFGWWFSQPGLFNRLCLGTMFVSGVSTLLVNGNPLLRYDGYFILSDLIETPNLAARASLVVRRSLSRCCFGIEDSAAEQTPEARPGLLALYAVASFAYRILITFSIVLMLMTLLRPYRLEVLARTFGLMALAGLLAAPLWRLVQFLRSDGLRSQLKRRRTVGTGLVTAAAVGALVFLPLPQCVWGTLEIEPRDVQRVYVDVPGTVVGSTVRPGDVVTAGTVLARLENLDLELEMARLAGRTAEQRAELAALRQERFHNTSAALRIPELAKSLDALEELLAERRSQFARLTLAAARSGVVLPPFETPPDRDAALGDLPGWSGLPTDVDNRGAALGEGTLVCQIGDPHCWQALVVVDQTDVNLLNVGQKVEIRFDEMPNVVVEASVDEISRRELAESPRHLSNKVGGELATRTDPAGVERPLSASYQVRVVLYDPRALLRIGLRGTARIHVPAEPLASRAARWVSRTFHFQL